MRSDRVIQFLAHWLPLALAFGALAFLAGSVVYLAGGPILSKDFWWHLKLGEIYWAVGPWLESDPFGYTAGDHKPDPQSWLFGLALYGIESAAGLPGVRWAHALATLGILWLVYATFRRESGSPLLACVASCAFIVLSWWRLMQLRPDLVSIAGVLLLYRLLLEPRDAPSWRRVGLFLLLIVVWANAHGLFAVGLCLLVAALAGYLLQALLLHGIAGAAAEAARAAGAARRLALALLLGVCAGLLNPKGLGGYLIFFSSSESRALWKIGDEWSPLNPFAWTRDPGGLSFLTWLTADALLLAFLLAAALGLWRFVRRPSPRALEGLDTVLLGLGVASLLAILIAFRFLWLSVFPLLFVLCGLRVALDGRPRLASQASGAFAAIGLALALAFPGPGGFRAVAADGSAGTSACSERHYDPYAFHVDGVRFLRDSGLEGNLFNAYWMGGFLDYWLAPRLRTFIDGRMRFPDEVLDDYFSVNFLRGARPGEGFLDVLERRQVDVFFGVGYPTPLPLHRRRVYTAAHLEDASDWLLVSRSVHHAVYLRRGERNRENLSRVAAYYAREGVPFDPARGFDVAEVIRARPDWAQRHGMLPRDYADLYAARRSPDPQTRFRALDGLGLVHALLGDYAQQVAFDRRAAALEPDRYAPRRRLVNGLFRLGRSQEALVAARKLSQLDPAEPRNALILRIAQAAAAADAEPGRPERMSLRQKIHRLPAVSEAEVRELRSRLDCRPLEAE
jgi:hypothetical protein